MLNKKIIRELEENNRGHILFNEQNASDLDELKEILEERDQIVIDFPVEEWNNAKKIIDNETKPFDLRTTRQYIATKLLDKLKDHYPQLKEYSSKRKKQIFESGDIEKYLENEDIIYNLYDVRDILDIEDIELDRVHFIMNGVRSNILCDALSVLLKDENPFDVSIYTSPDSFSTKTVPDRYDDSYLWEAYNFTVFNRFDEGIRNTATRPSKMY